MLVVKPTAKTRRKLRQLKLRKPPKVKVPVSFVMAGAKDADKRSSAAVGLRR